MRRATPGNAPRARRLAGAVAAGILLSACAARAPVRGDRPERLARWYYGVVGYKMRHWPDSASRFASAERCYRLSADRSRCGRTCTRTLNREP